MTGVVFELAVLVVAVVVLTYEVRHASKRIADAIQRHAPAQDCSLTNELQQITFKLEAIAANIWETKK